MKDTQNKQKCPRCDSFNTKFCYYNNYSLSQPRYFCKSCRRYWTHGGTLRNVPIGGGSRKPSKRSKTLPTSSSSSSAALHPNAPPVFVNSDPGYLPSLEPQILMNQSPLDLGVYSFGFSSDLTWPHRSFGADDRNPTWTAVNDDNATNSSAAAGNNKNSSAQSEINCCNNLVQNQWSHHHHLPAYGHPP